MLMWGKKKIKHVRILEKQTSTLKYYEEQTVILSSR